LIRNLHQYADTPGKPQAAEVPQSAKDQASGLLRLEKEMREHEKGKADALRKVAILEEQLQKLKEKGDPQEELDALVQMAERDGEVAALQWARQKASGTTPRGPIQVR
jgi:phage protein D